MEREFSKQRLIKNILRFGVYFLAVVLTPLLFGTSSWIVRAFDWVGYSQMRPFFKELFTSIFWILEMIAFYFIERKHYPKAERSSALAISGVKEKLSKKATETENEGGMVATNEETEQKKTKRKTPLLPLKNVVMLTALVAACILVLSAQIDFLVKPFYDIGEKVQGYDMFNRVSVIARNVVKCVWIVWMLAASREIACEVCLFGKNETEKLGIFFGVYMGLFFLFALYDVLTAGMTLGIGVTYFVLFYPCFVAVDALTRHSPVKSYILIMLIYIF